MSDRGFQRRRARNPKRHCPAFTLIELLTSVAIIAVLAAIAVPNFLEAQVRSKLAATWDHMHTLAAALEAYWIDQRAYPPNLLGTAVVRPPAPGQPYDPGIAWTHRIDLGDGRWVCETSSSLVLRLGQVPNRPFTDYPLAYNAMTLIRLTTPLAHIGHLPGDSFFRHPHNGDKLYFRPPGVWGPIDVATAPTWEMERLRPLGYFNFTEIDPDGLSIGSFGRTVPYVLTSPGPDRRIDFTDSNAAFPTHYDPTNGTVSGGDLILLGGD